MSCKLCGSNNTQFLFNSQNTHGRHLVNGKDSFSVSKCRECGLVFLPETIISEEYYKKYYEQGYYGQAGVKKHGILEKILVLVSFLSLKNKQRIIANATKLKRKISILDIGCGAGIFLSQLDFDKFDKTGIEINKEGYGVARQRGLSIFNQDISTIDFGGKKFDTVSLWHVLEHIDDPKALFENINKNINDHGILIFQVPNTQSIGFKYGKKQWFHLDSPRHLMLYNERSVRRLCDLTGFEVVSIKNEFYDYPLDLFWSVRKSVIRFVIYPLYPIFKMFSREHLTFVCKKK